MPHRKTTGERMLLEVHFEFVSIGDDRPFETFEGDLGDGRRRRANS